MSSPKAFDGVNTPTRVLRKADCQWRFLDFLLEQIFLVEKEYNRRVSKPLVVADGVEQLHTFHHTILQNYVYLFILFIY